MMKKFTSILLGLILITSFSLTGCQSETGPETNTGDAISSAAITPSAASSGERDSANNDEKADKTESDPGAVTETSVPQTDQAAETNQPAQTAGDLKITAEGVPVEVRLASDGKYSYEYDKTEYAVTTTTNGSTFEIKVTDLTPEIGNVDYVEIYIPDQSYNLITGISTASSLILPAINVNITVTSNASSVEITLPSDYNKTLNFTGNTSSCSLSMSDMNDFAVTAKISTSSVLVPSDWPAYDMISSDYSHTNGKGTAKINLDITSSSFVFE